MVDKHEHPLIYIRANRDWDCKICSKNYDKNQSSYYCSNCYFNICANCMAKLSNEKRYQNFYTELNKDLNLNIVCIKGDKHALIYCLTQRHDKEPTSWICNQCLNKYRNKDWTLYCILCDYDVFYNCYKKYLYK